MEKEFIQNWRLFSLPFKPEMARGLTHAHHAVQLIAQAGKHLIEPEPDDSHTAMQWHQEQNSMVGGLIPAGCPFHLGFNLSTFCLEVYNTEMIELESFAVEGDTRETLFEWLQQVLESRGVDPGKVKDELHYSLEPHELDKGAPFIKPSEHIRREMINYRHNADCVLDYFRKKFADAGTTYIWPHHFDTSMVIPLEIGTSGVLTRSLGLGLALPDEVVQEPYFYLTLWSEGGSAELKADFPGPGNWNNRGWTGAWLGISSFLKTYHAEEQAGMVLEFYRSALHLARQKMI